MQPVIWARLRRLVWSLRPNRSAELTAKPAGGYTRSDRHSTNRWF